MGAVLTLRDLSEKVQEYMRRGYQQDVYAACREAQKATRDFIARTHPSTAFGGKKLAGSQIIIGKYDIEASGWLRIFMPTIFRVGITRAHLGGS
jgi:hypothetical protein